MIKRNISGAKPNFFERDKDIICEVEDVLKSGILTQGSYLERFENSFSVAIGSKYCLGTNSGGTALEIILKAVDVRGAKVIVPTDTFVATPASVIQAGGEVVFADVEKETLSLNIEDVKSKITDNVKAIIVVHMFGIISDSIIELQEICHSKGITLIEDAAHAHGASYKNIPAGMLSDISAFSFYATKIVTMGEGGAIITKNKRIYKKVWALRNHGKKESSNEFDFISNNYRLSEIQAILGYHQLLDLDKNIKMREEIAAVYTKELSQLNDIELFKTSTKGRHSFWRFPFYISENIDRNKLQSRMEDEYGIRINWMYDPLCHLQPVYRKLCNTAEGDFPIAEKCIKRLICLPNHTWVSKHDAKYITYGIKESLARCKK